MSARLILTQLIKMLQRIFLMEFMLTCLFDRSSHPHSNPIQYFYANLVFELIISSNVNRHQINDEEKTAFHLNIQQNLH